jgi:gluconate 5-dehydrogenase
MSIQSLFDLTSRIAIVTGGATGLGKQMSTALAEAGAHVVVASRNLERCQQIANELRALGGTPLAYQLDLAQPANATAMVAAVLAAYGRIDILVNNSAATDVNKPFEPFDVTRWEGVLKVNLTGVMVCAEAVHAAMKAQGGGKIINVASVYGMVGVDTRLYGASPERPMLNSAYTASKGAVINLTRDLAVAWAPDGIRVNAISPGMFPVESNMKKWPEGTFEQLSRRVPLVRMGNDTDLKGAVIYLASSASDYVTGHNLVVDGGWTAW